MRCGSVTAKNELLMKDPSLLSEQARGMRTTRQSSRLTDGLKNFLLRVYSYIGGAAEWTALRAMRACHLRSRAGERPVEELADRHLLIGGAHSQVSEPVDLKSD
jgi:hypothetical protein